MEPQNEEFAGPVGREDRLSERRHMVEVQLRRRGIDDPRVLEAMLVVPREEFVPAELRHAAYSDAALSIPAGQTISQPFTVAFMASLLELRGDEHVLEIGTGSGYGAAVLSRLAARVDTVERIAELAESARRRLQRLGFHNVSVHLGDGSAGLPERAPFDAIIVTAAAERLPPAYAEQVVEGGRIVIPIGSAARGQIMYRFVRRGSHLEGEPHGAFAFVPLVEDETSAD